MSPVSVAQPDITLFLDNRGTITDASVANGVAGEAVTGWFGRLWRDTVGGVGADSVRGMIADARANGLSGFRQVTQQFPSGREMPVEYTTARRAGRAGLVAIGKSLLAVAELQSRLIAAQQAREQDSWKLREIETRYRLLFDASTEAVLIVDPDTLSVLERNQTAMHSLGIEQGQEMTAEVAPADRDRLLAMLVRVRDHGRAPAVIARIGPSLGAWTVRASMLTSEAGSPYLLQLAPVRTRGGAVGGRSETLPLPDLIERLPDGFVVLDRDGVIRRANRAFLDIAQAPIEATVLGRRLGQFFAVPGSDGSLLSGIQRHRAMRLFPAVLEGELGTERQVEIAAVGDSDVSPSHYGVLVRDISRRQPPPVSAAGLSTALDAVSDRLGPESMVEIVRDTVEAVERHCIIEALTRAGGNRSAAAELLGISRQSLYAKLNRYGILGDDAEDSGAAL